MFSYIHDGIYVYVCMHAHTRGRSLWINDCILNRAQHSNKCAHIYLLYTVITTSK